MARPLPKTNAPAFVKNQRIWASTPGVAVAVKPGQQEQGPAQRGQAPARAGPGQQAAGRRLHEQHHDAAQDEQAADLGLGPHGDQGHEPAIAHSSRSAAQRQAQELPRRAHDDADHRRAHAVERRLHPAEAAVGDVDRAQRQRHQERGEDERQPDQGGARDPAVDVAQAHGELGGEGPGRELREGQALHVVLLGEPRAALDEVALHVADERHRPAEAQAAQVEEVANEAPGRPRLAHARSPTVA